MHYLTNLIVHGNLCQCQCQCQPIQSCPGEEVPPTRTGIQPVAIKAWGIKAGASSYAASTRQLGHLNSQTTVGTNPCDLMQNNLVYDSGRVPVRLGTSMAEENQSHFKKKNSKNHRQAPPKISGLARILSMKPCRAGNDA